MSWRNGVDANGRNTILYSPFSGVAVRNGFAEDTTARLASRWRSTRSQVRRERRHRRDSTVPEPVDAHDNTIRLLRHRCRRHSEQQVHDIGSKDSPNGLCHTPR